MTSVEGGQTSLLILGLGNLICADDGLGVAAVHRLWELYEAPEGVSILDGGTQGLSLLPYVEDAERVILVDAIRDDAQPGSFVRLDGDQVAPAVAHRLSVHQIGVADLLDGARWLERLPTTLVLLGVVPESVELRFGLSPSVERRLPELIGEVVAEARRLGFELRPRHAYETGADVLLGGTHALELSAGS
jgi:hydrogenase maturation protease